MTRLSISSVSKSFAANRAVNAVDLDVASGEFVALLGPSGCGKTTLLRLIAGFERPEEGVIRLDDDIVASADCFVDPEDRHLGMVFQSYALWPTMTVAENIGFGLRVRGRSRRERDAAVQRALETVKLDGLGGRRPAQLSGGQRQRVALARCLALQSRLILLDEPLANLDAHLRSSVLEELRRIHREVGATFILVTHDQSEAMEVADRVVVMNAGRIEQIGTPEELYAMPSTPMVARFIGDSTLVPVEVRQHDGGLAFDLAGTSLVAPVDTPGAYLASLRAADVGLVDDEGIAADVVSCSYRGGFYIVRCRLAGSAIELNANSPVRLAPQAKVRVAIRRTWLLPAVREAA